MYGLIYLQKIDLFAIYFVCKCTTCWFYLYFVDGDFPHTHTYTKKKRSDSKVMVSTKNSVHKAKCIESTECHTVMLFLWYSHWQCLCVSFWMGGRRWWFMGIINPAYNFVRSFKWCASCSLVSSLCQSILMSSIR